MPDRSRSALALTDPAILRLVEAAAACLEAARTAMTLGAEIPNRHRPRLEMLVPQVRELADRLEGK